MTHRKRVTFNRWSPHDGRSGRERRSSKGSMGNPGPGRDSIRAHPELPAFLEEPIFSL